MAHPAGSKFGPYEVVSLLGAGGMGEVYRARDPRLGRDVAIKVLPAAAGSDTERLKRFEQEARAAGALNHPNVLSVYDIGSENGAPYIVSELLEGQTLRERLLAGPPPLRKVVEIGAQVARGLAAAHEKGIVHRDLKPENVFLTKDDRVKILDFGLAKLTKREEISPEFTGSPTDSLLTGAGTVFGTVGYMSPEQVRGEPASHRSDFFSFGTILYEMLSGKNPFRHATAAETMTAILKEEPSFAEPALTAAPGLSLIVGRCLEKSPAKRFHSSEDMAFALEALSQPTPSHPGLVSPPEKVSRFRVPALVGGILLVLLAGGYAATRLWPSGAPHLKFTQVTFGRADMWSARFAPDGSVVFSAPGGSRDGGKAPVHELFTVRPGTPEARPLGIAGDILAISRSGELAILQTNELSGPATLATVPLGGGAPREVLEDVARAASWSPDGRSLAVMHRVGGKQRLEFPIGHLLLETQAVGVGLDVSPDGKLVALTESGGGVSVVDLERHARVLGPRPFGALRPVWSPDGRSIWLNRIVGDNTEILSMGLDGSTRVAANIPGGAYVLHDMSRDGRILVERNSESTVMRAVIAGRERDLGWLDHFRPRGLSEDGKLLVFDVYGPGGGPSGAVYVRGTDGSTPKRIGSGQALALSRDGKWALCIAKGFIPPLTLVPTGPGQEKTLESGSLTRYGWAGFHPDGKSVWFNALESGGSWGWYMQSLAGGPPRPQPVGVPAPAEFRGVRGISPDGSLFVRSEGEDHRPEFVSLESGARRPVPGSEPWDFPLAWSSDGRSLFVQEGSQTVQRIDLATARRQKVVQLDLGEGFRPDSTLIFMSGDGRSWVYGAERFSSDFFVVEGLK